jgi:hypothetical protein
MGYRDASHGSLDDCVPSAGALGRCCQQASVRVDNLARNDPPGASGGGKEVRAVHAWNGKLGAVSGFLSTSPARSGRAVPADGVGGFANPRHGHGEVQRGEPSDHQGSQQIQPAKYWMIPKRKPLRGTPYALKNISSYQYANTGGGLSKRIIERNN